VDPTITHHMSHTTHIHVEILAARHVFMPTTS
jgi:hypothetical protein